MKKHPYSGLCCDERKHVMEDCGPEPSFDDYMASRNTGVNAEPSEGVRNGVASVKRLNPDHHIRTTRGFD